MFDQDDSGVAVFFSQSNQAGSTSETKAWAVPIVIAVPYLQALILCKHAHT